MEKHLSALIVSDRTEHVRSLKRILDGLPIAAHAASSLPEAKATPARIPVDVIFCDERLEKGSYRELLRANGAGRTRLQGLCFIVTLQTGEWDEYLEALELGAFEAIRCPIQPMDVELALIDWTRSHKKPVAMQMTA